MKKFKFTFAYGGQRPGDLMHEVSIVAESKAAAKLLFPQKWHSEFIESIKEESHQCMVYTFALMDIITDAKQFSITGVETSPCKVAGFDNGKELIEVCDPAEVEFWSVYAQMSDGRKLCIADYDKESDALVFAKFIDTIRSK